MSFELKMCEYSYISISYISISRNTRISILFMNNIYLKIFKTIWHKKLYMKICYNSKSL